MPDAKVPAQIAGNRSLDDLIHHCLGGIDQADVGRFRKQFGQLADEAPQKMHLVRELVVGAYLRSIGYAARYEVKIAGKTPDWTVPSPDAASIAFIVEVINFHIDQVTEEDIEERIRPCAVVCYWRDGKADNRARLRGRIEEKTIRYRDLANDLGIPFVVAVHSDFLVAVDVEEVSWCIADYGAALGIDHPELSGVLLLEDAGDQFLFSYVESVAAVRPLALPQGAYPPTS